MAQRVHPTQGCGAPQPHLLPAGPAAPSLSWLPAAPQPPRRPYRVPPEVRNTGDLLHPGDGERNPVPAPSQVGGWAGVPGTLLLSSCQLLCLVGPGSLGGTTRPVCTRGAVGPRLPLPTQPGAGNSLSHPLQLAGGGRWPGPPRLQYALANYRQAEISSSNLPASARLPTRGETQRQFNEGPG